MTIRAALSTVTLQRYTGIFSETFKLLNLILVLPVGTASIEWSSSYMKIIKTRIRKYHWPNPWSAHENCHWGPDFGCKLWWSSRDFQTNKQTNKRIVLWFTFLNKKRILLWVTIYIYNLKFSFLSFFFSKYICEMIYGLQLDCAIVFLVHWHNEAP